MNETAVLREPSPKIEKSKRESKVIAAPSQLPTGRRKLSILKPKTSEQLQRQAVILQYPYTAAEDIIDQIPEATQNPQEFLEKLAKMRAAKIEGKLPYSIGISWGYDDAVRHYDEYVSALRKMRRESRYRLEGQSISGADEALDKLNFSPGFANAIISSLAESQMSDELISDEDRDIAVKGIDELRSVVRKTLAKQPALILSREFVYTRREAEPIRNISLILPKEEVRQILLRAADDPRIIEEFTFVKRYLNSEDQRKIVETFMATEHDPYFDVALFRHQGTTDMFTPEQVRVLILNGIRTANRDPFLIKDVIESCVNEGIITREEFMQATLDRINGLMPMPSNFSYSSWFYSEEMEIIVDRMVAVAEQNPHNFITAIDTAFIFALNDQAQTEAIDAKIREFIGSIDLSEDEIIAIFRSGGRGISTDTENLLIDKLIDIGRVQDLMNGLRMGEIRGEELATAVAKIKDRVGLGEIYKNIAYINDILDPQVLGDLVLQAKTDEEKTILVQNLYSWADSFSFQEQDLAYVQGLLLEIAKKKPSVVMGVLSKAMQYFDKEQAENIQRELARSNAFELLIWKLEDNMKHNEPDVVMLSEQEIIQIGLSDAETIAFAPKTLTAIYRKISAEKSLQDQMGILTEASRIYTDIESIRNAGMTSDMRLIQESSSISAKDEKELLTTFGCLARMKLTDPKRFEGVKTYGSNLSEVRDFLFKELTKTLGTDQITSEQQERFLSIMGSAAPFTTYLEQYKGDPRYKEQLSAIFESIVNGTFTEWKYGAFDPTIFEEFRAKGLLPTNLSYEQYKTWRIDEQTSLVDTVSADATQTAAAIRGFLEENLEHLDIDSVMEEAKNGGDIASGVQRLLGSTGKELAELNIQLRDARKDQQSEKIILNLEERKITVEAKRAKLLRVRAVSRLMDLAPAEIASGFLINEGKEGKSRGVSIQGTISELRSQAAAENRFVYDAIETMIINAVASTGEKENLTAVDSSDPKVWIEIGENPVGSCQNYNGGSVNECLLGYTNPNTKILVLFRNEKLIARSVLRLGQLSNGNPALHVERIYSAYPGEGVTRVIYARAKQKAEEMGVPVFVSARSQTEQGNMEEAKGASGHILEPTEETLSFEASRAPTVYVDAVGGRTNGQFNMSGLLEIK